jgi:hypothetical protein
LPVSLGMSLRFPHGDGAGWIMAQPWTSRASKNQASRPSMDASGVAGTGQGLAAKRPEAVTRGLLREQDGAPTVRSSRPALGCAFGPSWPALNASSHPRPYPGQDGPDGRRAVRPHPRRGLALLPKPASFLARPTSWSIVSRPVVSPPKVAFLLGVPLMTTF